LAKRAFDAILASLHEAPSLPQVPIESKVCLPTAEQKRQVLLPEESEPTMTTTTTTTTGAVTTATGAGAATTATTRQCEYDVDPEPLGSGTFGKVYRVREEKDHNEYAIKVQRRVWTAEDGLEGELVSEIANQLQFRGHPNLAQIKSVKARCEAQAVSWRPRLAY
jgi:hypothetical protein